MTIVGVSFDVDFATHKTSKLSKGAFWALGKRIASLRTSHTGDEIAMYFMLREQRGLLCMGKGVAIQQAIFPMSELPLIQILRLTQSLDFEAIDEENIDLMFSIVGDRRDHRKMRDAIDRCILIARNPCMLNTIRTSRSTAEVIAVFEETKKAEPALSASDGAGKLSTYSPPGLEGQVNKIPV